MWVKRSLPLWSMPFCSNKTGTCLCRKQILLHFSNWARRWNKKEHCIISHTRWAEKGYRGKSKEWEEEDAKLAAEGKQMPWDQFPRRSRPYRRARVGMKKKNTSEWSGGITFTNPAVVGVADRVKPLAAQGSDGSFSGLGRMISSPQHLRLQSIEVGFERV
jgi:hypothetical protein